MKSTGICRAADLLQPSLVALLQVSHWPAIISALNPNATDTPSSQLPTLSGSRVNVGRNTCGGTASRATAVDQSPLRYEHRVQQSCDCDHTINKTR